MKLFKDRTDPKPPIKEPKNPYDFECPSYDNRNRVNCGTNYGVGFNQPVGHAGNPKKSEVIPKDCHHKPILQDK